MIEANQPLGSTAMNLVFGIYEDEYRLSDGHWRFHRRNFTLQNIAALKAEEIRKFAEFHAAFAVMQPE